MKKKALALLLLLALLGGLAGCGEPPVASLPRVEGSPSLLEELGLTTEDFTGMEDMLETVNATGEQDGAALHVLETLGDGFRLYLLASLTLPERLGKRPSDEVLLSLSNLALSLEPKAWSSMGCHALQYDPQSRNLYFLLEFTVEEPGYTGQTLTLFLDDDSRWEQRGGAVYGIHLSASWTAHNQAPRLTAQDRGGVCTISPLCLNVTLPLSVADLEGVDPSDPWEYVRMALQVVYRDGTVLGDLSGGGLMVDPIAVEDLRPTEYVFDLAQVDYVSLLDYSFVFHDQEGGGP